MTLNNKKRTTAIVGTGIVNLVTAYFLAKEGRDLVLIDKAPPPMEKQDWQKLGCTFGGENVRMYTYTEADNYNEKGHQLYSKMDEAFEQVIDNNGWLVREKSTLNEREQSWIEDFHSVTPKEAIQFAEDMYTVNIQSGDIWYRWMNEAPELFEGVDYVPSILRIYSEEADFFAARKQHSRLNSLTRSMKMEEILEEYPVFRHARQIDMLGGCMTTKGFTLKVHDFCKKIIRFLEDYGAEFRWNTTFSGIQRNEAGKVTGIFVEDELEEYDSYVLSLGAYSGTTLKNTQTNNQLHGVLGVWLTLPNLHPELKYSMKIHKTGHVGEDTNVTLIEQDGKPVLVLGSGYGYTGNSDRSHINCEELKGIFNSLKHTAQTYFPESYEAALPYLDETKKYCVRAWTPTGLGIFEAIPTIGGGQLIITGGNNTGGFTQSPYIADSVVKTLEGAKHPMQQLFHPKRMTGSLISSVS